MDPVVFCDSFWATKQESDLRVPTHQIKHFTEVWIEKFHGERGEVVALRHPAIFPQISGMRVTTEYHLARVVS